MRNITLDIVRVVLALIVVAIHGGFLADIDPLASFLTIHGLFRVVVPIFFLISGYYFHSTLKKQRASGWLKHILILYIVWMLIYLPQWFSISEDALETLLDNLQKLVFGYFHLWYLAALVGAAALLTAISRWQSVSIARLAGGLALAGLGLQYGGLYGAFGDGELARFLGFSWTFRNFLFFAFPFFVLGFLICEVEQSIKLSRPLLAVLALFGGIGMVVEAWLSYRSFGSEGILDIFFAQYLLVPALFLLALRTPHYVKTAGLASVSTGIYLIHPYCITAAAALGVPGSILLVTVAALFSVLVAFLLTRLNTHMRYLL